MLALLCRRAWAADRTVLVARVAATPSDAFLERVRGQVSDLPVEVHAAELEAVAPASERTQTALRLGRERGALAVVWIESQADGALLVHVTASDSGEHLVRRLEASSEHGDKALSEEVETAAVVVRATLEALLHTGHIGGSAEPAGPDEPARALEPPAPERPVTRQTPPARPAPSARPAPLASPSPRSSPVAVRPAIGWLAVVDGQTPAGLHGPLARVDVVRKNVGIGVHGAISIPAPMDAGAVELRVMRSSAGADVMIAFPLDPIWSIEAHAGGGLAVFHRSTTARAGAGAVPTPASTALTAELTSDLVVALVPLRDQPALRMLASAGAALLFAPPQYDFVDERGLVVPGPALWPIQPRLTVGLGWAF